MDVLIDFNNPESFPDVLKDWGIDFENMIRKRIDISNVREWWQIKHQLQDMRLKDTKIVTEFVDNNLDVEVMLYHCTRILDEQQYWKQGIITDGGKNSVGERRLRELLYNIGLNDNQIDEIFEHVYHLWKRDEMSRTKAVHFFIDENQVYRDDKINHFAINLGGEILRWALCAKDKNMYKIEPYKRLWIWGTPSVVVFKSKLENVHRLYRYDLIAEILKYYIVNEIFGYRYEFDFTGMTTGSVLPEDIVSIKRIENYIQMQEKYPDYEGYYDELK